MTQAAIYFKAEAPKERWAEHRRVARRPRSKKFSHVHAAIAKYGPRAFRFRVEPLRYIREAAARKTPEERRAQILTGWETRRRNKEAAKRG